MGGAVERVAHHQHLGAEVAPQHRAGILHGQVLQVEVALQPAQEELELEEHLLAAVHPEVAHPAVAVVQRTGALALALLHHLEEEVLVEGDGLRAQKSSVCARGGGVRAKCW